MKVTPPEDVMKSIEAIIGYLYQEEKGHWEELGKLPEHIHSHIYWDIRRVRIWAVKHRRRQRARQRANERREERTKNMLQGGAGHGDYIKRNDGYEN